jgi:superfamily II DNA helicase RecQ
MWHGTPTWPSSRKRSSTITSDRTPPAKKGRQHQEGDKYELSPTGRAKCRKCHQLIQKDEKRVGKEVWDDKYSNFIHHYYHDQCFPTALKEQLKLKADTPEDELARAVKEKLKQKSVVHGERLELYEALRNLRRGFGRALGCENKLYMVFHDKTLEEMTMKMPKNQRDMIANVYGMGPKKYESFGEAFLQVIQHYARKYARVSSSSSSTSSYRLPVALFAAADTTTAQLDDVVPLESLSCDEIIQRKFEDAAASGYVISL